MNITVEAPTSSQSGYQTVTEMLSKLIEHAGYSWYTTNTNCEKYTTNIAALHYAIDLNVFRLREVDNIVVLGLRGLETVGQHQPNYVNQGLSPGQREPQDVAATQLAVVGEIRDRIRAHLRNHAPVNIYVCDQDFTKGLKLALRHSGFTVFGRDDLSSRINQNSLVYDVTVDANELQRAVDFSWTRNLVPPAAVITRMNTLSLSGTLDVDLLGKYWVSPLMEFTPSVIVSQEMLQDLGSGPDSPLGYHEWVDLQESYSQKVQRSYFEEVAIRRSWVSDPIMLMLCRKDIPRPPAIMQYSQEHYDLHQQQQAAYQQGEGYEGTDESEETAECLGTGGPGGSSYESYASGPGPYAHCHVSYR